VTFERLLTVVADEPLFDSALLLAGDVDPGDVRRQLCRWVASGRIVQLRRGVYALAPPYRKHSPHPFVVANRLARPSYVSLQSALSFHGLIPEYVPVTASVTTRRPARWDTPLGSFEYRHIQVDLLRGYRSQTFAGEQVAFVATPEKALLDLLYLEPGADSRAYLRELRLQNLDRLDLDHLATLARSLGGPKLVRAAARIADLAGEEAADFQSLPS
jgi:predicted transcriptional regulator of viral defense system